MAKVEKSKSKSGEASAPDKVPGSWAFLIFCTSGIYSCYLYYGFLMERLSHECYCPQPSDRTCCIDPISGTKSPTWRYNYVSLVLQCVFAAVVAKIACCMSPQPDSGRQESLFKTRSVPLPTTRAGSTHSTADAGSQLADTATAAVARAPADAPQTVDAGRASQAVAEANRRVPWHKYAIIGFSYVGAMFLGQKSLQFISFPTQVIVKSCKMVPVMVSGALLHKEKYGKADYIRVFMVTVGIVVFTFFKDAHKSASSGAEVSVWNEVFGLVLAFSSLVLDGFVSPNQQAVTKEYKSSPYQNMYYSNMWGVVFPLCLTLGAGELQPALVAVINNPSLLFDLTCFGFLSAAGQVFIFLAMDSFGSLTLVTITTTRKFFTVLGSIIIYNHSVSVGQVAGMFMVFGGLAWKEVSHALNKDKEKKH